MNKYKKGIMTGVIAGVINCLFLIFAKDIEIVVYISTFVTWMVIGLFISSVDFKINNIFKGILVSLFVSFPSLVYTFSSTLFGAIWTTITTLFVGAFMGFIIEKINNKDI